MLRAVCDFVTEDAPNKSISGFSELPQAMFLRMGRGFHTGLVFPGGRSRSVRRIWPPQAMRTRRCGFAGGGFLWPRLAVASDKRTECFFCRFAIVASDGGVAVRRVGRCTVGMRFYSLILRADAVVRVSGVNGFPRVIAMQAVVACELVMKNMLEQLSKP